MDKPSIKSTPRKGDLIPPDYTRCQTEITQPYNPFQLGGVRPKPQRCTAQPTHLLVETESDDGQLGQMTVCDSCLAKFREVGPTNRVKILPIRRSK